MEVRNLVTFLKVTELKSFSRAAEALDYSQSAVTVQIQQLERELGVQLFDRIGKTVSITQYGKDFVSYARDVVSAIARASAFASSDSELSGTVRVGTLNSLLTASFSNIVPLYHERFPHVQISLHAGNIASITEMLVKNELDIIYTLDEQIFDTQFVKVFEAQEDVVIVTNTENPLSAIVAVTIQADLLILLSDIDGLFDGDPRKNPDAKLIDTVEKIDEHIISLGGGSGSNLGTGGMATKLRAAQMATAAGCEMVIANGQSPEVLYDVAAGKRVGTRFLAKRDEV